MLVLARSVGEKLLIGDDITVQVVKAKHGRVVLGIEAPRSVTVDREEVAVLKKKKKEAASQK